MNAFAEILKFIDYLQNEDHSELARQYKTGAIGDSIGFDWYIPRHITRLDRFAATAEGRDMDNKYFRPITVGAKIRRMLIH